jgi:uncharacterized membrane protein
MNSDVVKDYIRRGAYSAALRELITIHHPIVHIFFPKLPPSDTLDSEVNNEIHLTEEEINVLNNFIDDTKSKNRIYATSFIVIGAVCFSVGLTTVLELAKYFEFLPQLVAVSFLPCCVAVMGTPWLFFAGWVMWKNFQSDTFGVL